MKISGLWFGQGRKYMKQGVDLIYKLNGDIEDGIDVFELAPFLLSFGKLINEAHKTLYPNEPEIAVNIKPFEKGSFEVNIWVYAKDVLQQILTYINSDAGRNIKDVLVNLGLITGISGINLLQIIAFLRTKKLEKIEPLNSGEFRYIANDNSSITVSPNVNALYLNCNIQQTIYNGIAKPLELEDVDSIDSFIKNNEEETKVNLKKEIAPAIKEYSSAELPILEEEKITENIRIVWVRPVTANLEGGPKSWSFRLGEDEKIIANISDVRFLEAIKGGARLSSMDKLLVVMKDKQIVRGKDISISHEIIEVKEYLKGPEQEYLFRNDMS